MRAAAWRGCARRRWSWPEGAGPSGGGGQVPCYVRRMTESVVLDTVDLRILRLLQNDARATYRELAEATGVAASTCLDRVTRLRRSG